MSRKSSAEKKAADSGESDNDVTNTQFSSTCSMFVTLMGYSLGMSDIWRFPFLAYRNGGGAFLIPFLITIVLCGIPLYFLEYSLANFCGKGPFGVWEISPVFRGVGMSIAFAYFLWIVGSTVFRSWLAIFLLDSFTTRLPWTHCQNPWNTPTCRDNPFITPMTKTNGSDTSNLNGLAENISVAINSTRGLTANSSGGMTAAEEYWQFQALGLSSGITDLSPILWKHILCMLVFRVVVFLSLVKSIKSIEKFYIVGLYKFSFIIKFDSMPLCLTFPIGLCFFLEMFAVWKMIFPQFIHQHIKERISSEKTRIISIVAAVMYVLTFAPLLFMVVIMVQSMTLPGIGDGLYEFFHPDFSKLKSSKVGVAFLPFPGPSIWIEAFLMAFYTLGFGWGGIIMLGSHANFHDNCIRTAIVVPILDSLGAILNGVVCFMILGNMAHAYGVKVYDVIEAGFSTGIVTYVSALSVLPVPQFWVFAFILNTLLMGLDTQIVPIEMCMQVIGEMYPNLYPKYRLHVLTVMSVLLFVLALPTCTGAGGYIFLWLDWYTGVWVGPICALTELIAVGWIYGMDRFSMDISLMIGRPAPWFFRVSIVFLAPIVVLVIFVAACVKYVPPKYGSYIYPSWARGVGWLIVFFILSPIIIKAFHVIYQQTGTLKTKIKKSTKTTKLWGPKDKDAKVGYCLHRDVYDENSVPDMLRFVVTGKYGKHAKVVSQKELDVLVQENK